MQAGKLFTTAVFALAISGLTHAASSPQGAKPGDAQAQGQERHGHDHHGMMRFSVEHAAMHNIMAELLSQKTGRPAADIKALFDKADTPRDAIDQLGLSHDDMRALFQQAHQTLITRAQGAGLITADQARELRSQPVPGMRHGHGDRDRGRDRDDDDDRAPPPGDE